MNRYFTLLKFIFSFLLTSSFIFQDLYSQTLQDSPSIHEWVRLGTSHDTCYWHPREGRSLISPRLPYFQELGKGLVLKDSPIILPIPQSEINVQYDAGFEANPDAKAAFQFAVDIWASELVSPVPILIDAQFSALGGNVLGSASPGGIYTTLNGPNASTAYVVALANAIDGEDIDPTGPDVLASFNSTANWYYGLDGNTPNNQFDFVSVVLHELGHGLGFTGNSNSGAGVGFSNGANPMSYDELVELGNGSTILSLGFGTTAQTSALIGDDLFQGGANARAALGGQRPKMYAPNPFNSGSSYSHLDESTFPGGDPNSLMTPFIGNGEAIHDIGDAVRGIYKDQGWTFVDDLSFPSQDVGVRAIVSPDVAADPFQARAEVELTIMIANFGSASQSSIPVGFQLNQNTPVIETLSISLGPQKMVEYTFSLSLDLSDSTQSYALTVFTGLGGDSNPDNDSLHVLLNPIFDQKEVLSSQSSASQIFPNIGGSFLESADDFEVGFGESFVLQYVSVNGTQQADSNIAQVKVSVYADTLGKPGNLISTQTIQAVRNQPNFLLSLDTAITLESGHYWVSVRPILNAGVQWFWSRRTGINHQAAHIRDPDNLTAQGITDWTSINADLSFCIGGKRNVLRPQALEASSITSSSFVARWEAISIATGYELDVSSDNFSTFALESQAVSSVQTEFSVSGLNPNTTYQYRVRFTGPSTVSPNSNVIEVSTCALPQEVSQALAFENGRDSSGRLTWTSGDGDGRLVLIKTGSDFTSADLPLDGTDYQADTTLGQGSSIGSASVVYQGTENHVILHGLQDGQTYFARVFEFTCPASKLYLGNDSSSISFTKTNCEAPTQNAQDLQVSQEGNGGIRVSWSAGNGSERLVLAKKSQTFTSQDLPVDGQIYQADTAFGMGSQIGHAFVVYKGSGQSLSISQIDPDTSFFITVVELNCLGSPLYKRDSLATESITLQICETPTLSASGLSFQNIGQGAIEVNFTQGNGTQRLVLMKAESSLDNRDYPVDGQVYSADSVFGQGNQIGQASVVYQGENERVQVSGLNSELIYFIQVVEFNCPEEPQYRMDSSTEISTVLTSQAEVFTNQGLRLYPIPSQDELTIAWTRGAIPLRTAYVLYNAMGKVIRKGDLIRLESGNQALLSLKGLPLGSYILGLPDLPDMPHFRFVKVE